MNKTIVKLKLKVPTSHYYYYSGMWDGKVSALNQDYSDNVSEFCLGDSDYLSAIWILL